MKLVMSSFIVKWIFPVITQRVANQSSKERISLDSNQRIHTDVFFSRYSTIVFCTSFFFGTVKNPLANNSAIFVLRVFLFVLPRITAMILVSRRLAVAAIEKPAAEI